MPQGDLLQSNVRGKLTSLKAGLKGRLAGEGLAWLVLAVVGLVFVTLGFDYLLRLDRGLRAVLMVAALAGVGYVLWRQLIAPLNVPMDEDALALLIECRWKELGDRLISAIQFSRAVDLPPGTSTVMISHMAQEANRMAAGIPVTQVVERRTLRRVASAAGAALALLVALTAWQPGTMNLWFMRNVLFQNVPWPQDTYLKVVRYTTGERETLRVVSLTDTDRDPLVLRGDPMVVTVTVDDRDSRVVPPFVVFHVDYPSVGATEERADLNSVDPDNPHVRTYDKKFDSVIEEFRFYVTGGDDSTDRDRRHQVRLIDPPSLHDVKFSIDYPHYMNRRPSPFEEVKGIVTVPLGADVTIQGVANKDLKWARFSVDDKEVAAASIVPDPETKNPRRGVIGRFTVQGPNRLGSQLLRVVMQDSSGYTNRGGQPYTIQVQPDSPPSVELRPRGIGSGVTSFAQIPVALKLTDDYGVAAAGVGVTLPKSASSAPASQPAGERPLATRASQPATMQAGKAVPVNPPPSGQKEYTTLHNVYLDSLATMPRVGEVVTIFAEAEDTMDPALGGPNRKTGVMEVRIVSADEIRSDLTRRQKEITIEFAQGALVVQKTSTDKTEEVVSALEAGQTPDNMRLRLTESAAGETAVGTQISNVSEKLETIYQEMVNNRVFPPDVEVELASIIKDLRDLGSPVEASRLSLNKAVGVIDSGKADPAALKDHAAAALDVQRMIFDRMEQIHKRMLKVESRQDIINLVIAIQGSWDKVIKGTDILIGIPLKGIMGTTTQTSKPSTGPATRP